MRTYCGCVIALRETPHPSEEPCGAIMFCCVYFSWESRKSGRLAVRVGSWRAVLAWVGGKAQSGIERIGLVFCNFTLGSLLVLCDVYTALTAWLASLIEVYQCLKNGKHWQPHSTVHWKPQPVRPPPQSTECWCPFWIYSGFAQTCWFRKQRLHHFSGKGVSVMKYYICWIRTE